MADIPPEWFHLLPYGYAPGSYMNRCISCGNVVSELDKRATRCKPCAVSSADNAALRAELERLTRELANARAADIHSCHASCTRAGCVAAGLREERDQLRKDVAALNKIIDTRLIDAARKATP